MANYYQKSNNIINNKNQIDNSYNNQNIVKNQNSKDKEIKPIISYKPVTSSKMPIVSNVSLFNKTNETYKPDSKLKRNDNYSQLFHISKKNNIYQNLNPYDVNLIISSKVGLKNLGNTCFMNTCLQNLIHSEDFIKRLLSKKSYIEDYSKKKPISSLFLDLCTQMVKNSNGYIEPTNFKNKFLMKHSLFKEYFQNDTQEFCRFLLQDMNMELNEVTKPMPYKELSTVGKSKKVCDEEFDELLRGRESSIVIDSFYGQIINIFTCENSECKLQTFSFQKVLELPLLLKGENPSIRELLNYFFEGETIKFESKCEKCKLKTMHKKETRISRPPNILILSLQRFNSRTKRKNNCGVSFPEELDISNYMDKECGNYYNCKYSLYGIGNHSGTISFGHYYAYIKLNDRFWWEFNDSRVTQKMTINKNSTSAYVLFYKKK